MPQIEEAVRTQLGGSAGLAALVGDRIYPGNVPAYDAPAPWIYYALVESNPDGQLDGPPTQVSGVVELDVLTETYEQWREIEKHIFDRIGFHRYGVVRRSVWIGSTYTSVQDGHQGNIRIAVDGPPH